MDHPLNKINYLFYSTCEEAFTTSGLADFFVKVEPVQEALYYQINSLFPHKNIRVKEICTGARPDRWQIITSSHPELPWAITLSDFSKNSLPPPSPFYQTLIEDLFKPPAPLPDSQKFDLILTTYGFDSLWFPQDSHYKKTAGIWSKAIFASTNLQVSFEDINILNQPYGQIISDYYQNYPDLSFNFPGGLIDYVQNIFTTQLKPGGVFLTGDVATASLPPRQPPFDTIGKTAKFQPQDYGIAKNVLTSLGFQVELYSLSDLLDKWNQTIPLDLSDHLFLQVYR